MNLQEDYRLGYLCAVGSRESASALLDGFGILSPALSLIRLPNQHHIEEHAATFLPEVDPLNCGYIAASK